jgi:hypothetical protein
MDFKITFRPDLDYYKEAYTEMAKKNKLKRLEPFFAIGMMFIGIILWYSDENGKLGYFPLLFGGLGIFEFYKAYTSKNKWLNERVKSNVTGQQIDLEFTDDHIIHNGPFSSGTMKWTGLKSIEQTEKGIIIKPESGIVIYLRKLLLNEEQIEFITSKGKS